MNRSVQKSFVSSRIPVLEPLVEEKISKSPSAPAIKSEVPLSDANVPSAAIMKDENEDKNHIDIVVNAPATLPPVGNPQFHDIFRSRIDVSMLMCDFASEKHDVDAKFVKNSVLQDFILFFESQANSTSLGDGEVQTLLDMIFAHVFREQQDVSQKYMFSDDFVPISEPSMPHLALVYQLLIQIIKAYPEQESLGERFMKRLISRYSTPDISERTLLIGVTTTWLGLHSDETDVIVSYLCTYLIEYMAKERTPHILFPCLSILYQNFSLNTEKYITHFTNYILPLLGAPHLTICQSQIQQIIELFINAHANLAVTIIKALLYHWPKTKSIKLVYFIQQIVYSMTKIKAREFKDIRVPVFKVIAKCSISSHQKVAEAAYSVWTKLPLEPMIMDSARVIFPIVYASVSKGLKTHWSSNIIDLLNSTMESMNRIDSFLFQELCRQKIPIKSEGERDIVRLWATVSRAAAMHDKSLNLALKLAEIQRTFVKQAQIPITASQSQKKVVSPSISPPKKPRLT